MSTAIQRHRRGRPSPPALSRPDVPYTMKLPDGRTIYVEVPGRWTVTDRSGQVGFLPPAVRFLDRLRAMSMKLNRAPSPGYITTLREALGMTQEQFGQKIGVNKLTVSRWERGTLRPGPDPIKRMEKLRQEAVSQGVVLPG